MTVRGRTGQVAAVDLGATSGRVMLATVGPDTFEMRQVTRFANDPVTLWNGHSQSMHWDLPGLFRHAAAGLAAAGRLVDTPLSIGVDSWAVDYGLLRDGRLIGLPHHYRDTRSEIGVEAVHRAIDPSELYERNGLQFLPFTSIYQLAAERADGLLDVADRALLIPDLIGYWLTGEMTTERTNASTTGLLGVDGRWDDELQQRVGLPADLFAPVVDPGNDLGPLLGGLGAQLGLPTSTRVVSVASHDTASAVVAVPMDASRAAYISCGTWGLVGVEIDHPVVHPDARAAGFTNEVGADGRIRFLHNVMGLWLLSETMRQYERDGMPADLAEILAQAAQAPAPFAVFDTDDPRFLSPGDIPARIVAWYAERDLPAPASRPAMVRAIVESLAAAFAATAHRAAELSGTPVETVHLVGGGSQNALLCQLTADRLGIPLLAGPVEATAIGNILLIARTQGLISGTLEEMRSMVATRFAPKRYIPQQSNSVDSRIAVARPAAIGRV